MGVKNEDLLPLFAEVKELLYLVQRAAPDGAQGRARLLHLWSEKDIVIDGRKRTDMYFCGVVIQKMYVGFYFMPLYADDAAVPSGSGSTACDAQGQVLLPPRSG